MKINKSAGLACTKLSNPALTSQIRVMARLCLMLFDKYITRAKVNASLLYKTEKQLKAFRMHGQNSSHYCSGSVGSSKFFWLGGKDELPDPRQA